MWAVLPLFERELQKNMIVVPGFRYMSVNAKLHSLILNNIQYSVHSFIEYYSYSIVFLIPNGSGILNINQYQEGNRVLTFRYLNRRIEFNEFVLVSFERGDEAKTRTLNSPSRG